MKILDLFCGEGGAARGYLQDGHEVVGVDHNAACGKYYPGTFIHADAIDYLLHGRLTGYDLIHASPPCQGYSVATEGQGRRSRYTRAIATTREGIAATGLPYVIENVEGARPHLRGPILLCGRMFNLTAQDDDGTWLVLDRHRLFETSVRLNPPPHPHPPASRVPVQVGGVYGGGRSDRHQARYIRRGGYTPTKTVRAALLGLKADDMTQHGLSQAIPPAYTHWIIRAMKEHL